MKYSAILVFSLLTAVSMLAAPPGQMPSDSGDGALLGRVRQVVAGMLVRLPNFTCLETLERSERMGGEKRFRLLDRLRLEVAYVNGQELYAWPGSSKFDETALHSLITGAGAYGTGDFGEHLRVTYREDMPLKLAGKDARRQARDKSRGATQQFVLAKNMVESIATDLDRILTAWQAPDEGGAS